MNQGPHRDPIRSPHRDRVEREAERALDAAVITVSDSRSRETDVGGHLICRRLREAGHRVASYSIVPDDPEIVREHAGSVVELGIALLVTTGGTGITRRDSTIEAIRPLLDRKMYGFGELFRMLSFEEIGPAAMLSRAIAGTARRTLVFALPGSPHAIELALDRLILPDLPHLAWETVRQ